MESIFSQVAAQRPRNHEIRYPGGSQGVLMWEDTFSKMGPGQASENKHFSRLDRSRPQATIQAKSYPSHSLLPGHPALGGDYRGVEFNLFH